MVKTASTMLPLGTSAPDFSLPDVNGSTVSRSDFSEKPLLVAFICNHCPFVVHLRDAFTKFASDYQAKGLGLVAVSSNDISTHPDDSPDLMKSDAEKYGYTFPYLYDESQEVAKKYTAACTPDFFLFDQNHKLVYRGQFDDSRPGNGEPITGADLKAAVNAVLAGQEVSSTQYPSIGCNIKWKAGAEPSYFTGQPAE